MAGEGRTVLWFSEITRSDVAEAGGKGASLGEMTRANIPVPPGFVVTSRAYSRFMEESGLNQRIRDVLNDTDLSDNEQLNALAGAIQQVIVEEPMPDDIAGKIRAAYQKMGDGAVAVRSSATMEDSGELSFAGQHSSYLNVQSPDDVVAAVKKCWASIFEPRAISYRVANNIDHLEIKMAVPVQKMVQSKTSGTLFTVEPVFQDRNKMVLEAVYGLGESLVSGEITPDTYIIRKSDLSILDKSLVKQMYELVRNTMPYRSEDTANIKVKIPEGRQNRQKLRDDKIKAIGKLGKELEELYGFPVDIEWAKENGDVYIVQTRPITAI